MKWFKISTVAIVLGVFLCCSVTDAKYTVVVVSKNSKVEQQLRYKLTLEEAPDFSEFRGTFTFDFQAPRIPSLQNLSRIILLVHDDGKLVGRFPLEIQKGSAGEVGCHFQLTSKMAKNSTLELVCPVPNMPNGVVYQVDLSTYLIPMQR